MTKTPLDRLRDLINAVDDDNTRICLHRAANIVGDQAGRLERRLDASAPYLRDLRLRLAKPPATGWRASLSTDRIGNAEEVFVCYRDSPADAVDAVLQAASTWIQAQKDIR